MTKRVVFLIQNLDTGGAQRHTVGIIKALASQFDFWIVTQDNRVAPGMITEEIQRQTVLLSHGRLLNPFNWIRIGREIAALKPDLVVAINQIPAVLVLVGRMSGALRCPYAVIIHSTSVMSFRGWVWTIAFYPAVWLSNCLIYISSNQERLWRPRGMTSRRVETIRNGIDVSKFTVPTTQERCQAKVEIGLTPDDFVIGLCAVFRIEKNHRQLLHALAHLLKKQVRAKLLFVGEGDTRRETEELSRQLGIASHVLFVGKQNDVRPYIAAMDVGVLPSTAIETLSLSALECMAMGVPMIMSNIGGASEIIQDGKNGLLFKAGDTAALIEALERCTVDPFRLSLGQQARDSITLCFDQHAMNERYRAVFDAL